MWVPSMMSISTALSATTDALAPFSSRKDISPNISPSSRIANGTPRPRWSRSTRTVPLRMTKIARWRDASSRMTSSGAYRRRSAHS